MNEQSQARSIAGTIATGAAIGALAMYLLDPDRGRRRRAIARDKARSVFTDGVQLIDSATRDARFRLHGLWAELRRQSRREVPDDLVLIERVRAKLGRACSHPHAIHVGASEGRITISGPILSREARQLLAVVHAVPGVKDVEDHLVAYERPDSIPALQGGAHSDERSEPMQQSWTPSLRVAAILGGTAAALAGAREGGIGGLALAGLGAAIAARGATNLPIRRLAGNRRLAMLLCGDPKRRLDDDRTHMKSSVGHGAAPKHAAARTTGHAQAAH